jgi:hypothetical protein
MLPRLFFFNSSGEYDDLCLSRNVFDLSFDRSERCPDEWLGRSLGV